MISRTNLSGDRVAVFSDCERYRYRLLSRWGEGPLFNACMLNPSTADEMANDATVERIERRARSMGFGGFVVTNLFAFRATLPKNMKAADDPIGPDNNDAIMAAAREAGIVLCAWGNDGDFRHRSSIILANLRRDPLVAAKLHYLKLTGKGQPYHPLYVGYDLLPVPYAVRP